MRLSPKLYGRNQQGFTLVEIMVATMMTAAIVAAGFGALVVSQKTTRITGQIGSTQATARNAMDMITADLKLAGFGMRGLTTTVGGCHINGTPYALVPGDNNPLGADTGPDTISMVVPMTNSITAVGPLWQVFVPGAPGTIGGLQTPISSIPMPANATTAMGNAIPGGGAALLGMPVSIGGMAGSTIQAVSPGALTLNPAIPTPAAFGSGTQVYLLQCITYQVIPPSPPPALPGSDPLNLCQGNAPCLVRGAVPAVLVGPGGPPNCNQVNSGCIPIMDGVEDLQLAYACDGCDPRVNSGTPDLQPDDLNLSNNFDQADFITDRNWFGTAGPYGSFMTPRTIRLVQVNIVARQTKADQGMGEMQSTAVHGGRFPVISDHSHATGLFALGDTASAAQQSAYFQFRRRVLTRTVELRNQRL
ncbi:MAG: PilW family protein [Nitrospira sp.]|jgi:type IV pilus assembly protein PilW|nr:PilW family protein [Nitrospira sp.]MDH4243006.1 PilW family protein [Nitrospira sp.]MDH4357090.1 PilW family protein [Nitrospira sp.]MDH5317303.1 PilW family protein [Nitrospira sp.]